MFVRLPKGALAQVAAKNLESLNHKSLKLNHPCSSEKGKSGEASITMAPPTISTVMTPSAVDLEAGLDSLPEFDEYVVDLPQYILGGHSSKEKETIPPPFLMMLTAPSITCGLSSLRRTWQTSGTSHRLSWLKVIFLLGQGMCFIHVCLLLFNMFLC